MPSVRRQISPHAAALRRDQTEAEKHVWSAVRNRALGGLKFRRQATLGPFIVDFLCVGAMLIVELDGGQHDDVSDAARTHLLEDQGYCVLRFWNKEVSGNFDGVLERILVVANERIASKKKTLTQSSPAKAGEGQEGSLNP